MDVVDAELRLGSPSDERTKTEKVRVIACGAIAREVIAVSETNGLSHIDLQCLPAIWHAHPEKIAPGVEKAVEEARADGFDRIFVGYADCGTGGLLDRVCERLGLDRHPQLKDMYFGNYTKVVYLSQIEDEGLQKKAKEAADYLGLAYEYRFTGYGDLTGELLRAR